MYCLLLQLPGCRWDVRRASVDSLYLALWVRFDFRTNLNTIFRSLGSAVHFNRLTFGFLSNSRPSINMALRYITQ